MLIFKIICIILAVDLLLSVFEARMIFKFIQTEELFEEEEAKLKKIIKVTSWRLVIEIGCILVYIIMN